jgi:hypothetical protein
MKQLIHIFFCLIITWSAQAQYGIGQLYEELPGDSIPKKSVELHSGLKPAIRQTDFKSLKRRKIIFSSHRLLT